jgi:hypothetical protein
MRVSFEWKMVENSFPDEEILCNSFDDFRKGDSP